MNLRRPFSTTSMAAFMAAQDLPPLGRPASTFTRWAQKMVRKSVRDSIAGIRAALAGTTSMVMLLNASQSGSALVSVAASHSSWRRSRREISRSLTASSLSRNSASLRSAAADLRSPGMSHFGYTVLAFLFARSSRAARLRCSSASRSRLTVTSASRSALACSCSAGQLQYGLSLSTMFPQCGHRQYPGGTVVLSTRPQYLGGSWVHYRARR